MYVANGLVEFFEKLDAAKDRVWICEDEEKIVRFLSLVNRSGYTAKGVKIR